MAKMTVRSSSQPPPVTSHVACKYVLRKYIYTNKQKKMSKQQQKIKTNHSSDIYIT